jgi:hypothetical protein
MRIGASIEMNKDHTTPLGQISAVSDWLGAGDPGLSDLARSRALRKLVRAAEDFDADGLLDVNYSEEYLPRSENPAASPLKRVRAAAIAVKFKPI